MKQPEFLPTTREEMSALGWDELDILLVSGDAYVDSHSFGISLLGRWLMEHGYRTGIVAQPRWEDAEDVSRLGRPRLFAGLSAGAMDSLLAHYTAFRKKRSQDAYSPGGVMGLRPNRAGIVYTGLLRQAFPGLPVVAGGIEASLRRASHYDFWSDSLRRSFVLDSKADAVLFGMGEHSILALARLFETNDAREQPGKAVAAARLPGTAYAVHPDAIPADAEELPSHEAILAEPFLLVKATMAFERQMLNGGPCLVQRSGGRAVVFEPPATPLSTEEMDRIYGLPFTRRAHPSYEAEIPAVAMIESSVTSHRGCGGGCSFCALASHQGRVIQSRSADSLIAEMESMAAQPDWKGSITDVGGPSANMWRAECASDPAACKRDSCLFPKRCRNFQAPQEKQTELLHRAGCLDGVKHIRIASGVRHDLALDSEPYLKALVGEFTGGQLKIAPEHISEKVLRLMRKPPVKIWNEFLRQFKKLSQEAGKEQYVVPYLMSAFPGCTDRDMEELGQWLRMRGWRPQQVQCFIPTPGTVATAMFFSERDVDGHPITVARTDADRLRQHRILVPDAEPAPAKRPGASRPDQRRSGGFRSRTGPPRERGERPPFKGRPRAGGDDARPDFKKRPRADGDDSRSDFKGRPRADGGDSRPDFKRRPRADGGDSRPDFKRRPRAGGDDSRSDFKGRPRAGGGDSRPDFKKRPHAGGGDSRADFKGRSRDSGGGSRPGFKGRPRDGGSSAGGGKGFRKDGPRGGGPRRGGKP